MKKIYNLLIAFIFSIAILISASSDINLNANAASSLTSPYLNFTNITSSSMTINWTSVSGATSYKVYACTSESGVPYTTPIYSVTGNSVHSFDYRGLNSNTTYYFMVKAFNDSGNSASSKIYNKATSTAATNTTTTLGTPYLNFSSITSSSISFNWSAVSGASHYDVYACTSKSGISYTDPIYTAGGSAPFSFTYSDLSANTTYYFMITAYGANGKTASSPIYTKTTLAKTVAPVATPALSFSNITSSSITINWSSSANAVYYELYGCSSESGLEYNLLSTNGGRDSYSYSHENLTSNTTYYYMIKAYNGSGNSGTSTVYSKKTKTLPTVPALSFSDISSSSITINWNSTTNAVYYELYGCSSESGLEYNLLSTNGGRDSYSYTHGNLTSNTTYYYMIKAFNTTGESATSFVYTEKTTIPTLGTPYLQFSGSTPSSISISWNEVTKAAYYELYSCTSESGLEYNLLSTINTGSNLSYTHDNLSESTTYYYMIKAFDGNGNSTSSPVYSKKTTTTFKAPALSFSYVDSSSITINWSPSNGAVYYELYGCSSESGLEYNLLSTNGGRDSYSYTHENLTSDTTYYYMIKAYSSTGNSVSSFVYTQDTKSPEFIAPALSFSNITSSSITVSWEASADAVRYELYADTSLGIITTIPIYITSEGTSFSYTHSNLSDETTYYYMLKAYDKNGNCSSSFVYQKKTTAVFKAPALSFSDIDSSSITITWDSTNAIYYELYGCSSESGLEYNLLSTNGGRDSYSYTHENLTSDTTYYYMIKAYSNPNSSVSSFVYTEKTAASTLDTPYLRFSGTTPSSISISWSEVAEAVYYELYSCTSESGLEYNLLSTIIASSTLSYTHDNLSESTTYYYMIKAFDGNGNSTSSPVYSKKTTTTFKAPALSFSDIDSSLITINWSPSNGAVYYELYGCSSESGLEYNLLLTDGGRSSYSYTHENLTSNTTYYYMIKAYSSTGNSVSSFVYTEKTAVSTLGTPYLSFSDITSSSISVSWDEAVEAVYYELYSCTSESGLEYNLLSTINANATLSYTHYNLSESTTYYYMIKAYDCNGNSTSSPVYSKKTTTTFKAPALSFSDIDSSSVTINWSPVSGAIYYELYGCSSESGLEYNLLSTNGGRDSYSYTHENLTSDTTYYYMIKAFSSSGNSVSSFVYTEKTAALGTSYLSFSDITSSSISVSWDEAVEAVYYELYSCTSESGLEYNLLSTIIASSTLSYTHDNLSESTTYYYMIKAYDCNGNSTSSPVYSKKTTAAFEAPALSFANVNSSSITINWSPVSGAIYYELYGCSSESGLEYNLLLTDGGRSSYSYTHENLTYNTTYYYMIKAYSSANSSVSSFVYTKETWPDIDSPTPPALSFSNITTSSITVNWSEATYATYYELYSCTSESGLEYSLIATINNGTFSYIHNNLLENTTYYYIIKAYDENGSYTVSPNAYSVKTAASPVAPVLTFTDITPISITINWDRTSNGVYYELYTCTSDGTLEGDYIYTMGGQPTYSFTHTNLKTNSVHYYKLLEYSRNNEPIASETYCVYTEGDLIFWYNYNANGGVNAPSAQHVTQNTNLIISEQIPTRTGYNFKGWKVSGTDTVYYPGDVVTLVNSDANLIAIWEEVLLYTDDTIDDACIHECPYYVEGNDYSANGVAINHSIDGLHYFRICSSTEELVVTLKVPIDADVSAVLTTFPYDMTSLYNVDNFRTSSKVKVDYLQKDVVEAIKYKTITYTYKTKHAYDGQPYYDFGLCISSSDTITYDCNVKYTYPASVKVSNGGIWRSDWSYDNDDIDNKGMTSERIITCKYNVNDISYELNSTQMAFTNYWYLTDEQKDMWQKICNYLYSDDMLTLCKAFAQDEFTDEIKSIFNDILEDEVIASDFAKLSEDSKMTLLERLPDLSEKEQIRKLIVEYVTRTRDEFVNMYNEALLEYCNSVIDKVSTFAYNPLLIINAIEEDLYMSSLNGTLPAKLTTLAAAVDNHTIYSLYINDVFTEETRKALKETVFDAILSTVADKGVDYLVTHGLLTPDMYIYLKSIEVIIKITMAVRDLLEVYDWCDNAKSFRDSVNDYCSKISYGIRTNALTATYYTNYRRDLASNYFQEYAPYDCCSWDGTTIPRRMHYDIIGNVVEFKSNTI